MGARPPESSKILIADDQPDVLEALYLLLRREGYVVETASSPAAVLEALTRETYDTLLIDLNYARDTTSGREGIELLSRIQALDSVLPTVVMTGWASIEVAVEAMRHGAREFVQKPWDNEQLLAILRRQIALCKSLRRRRRAEVERRRETMMAAEAQRSLLPQREPEKERLEFFAVCQPASEVGGDYYDFIELDQHRTAFSIADVEGKGMSAALFASMVQAAVRSHARVEGISPSRLISSVNELLRTSARAQSFSTLFYAVIDEEQGTLRYVNAGHNPPLVLRAGANPFRHARPQARQGQALRERPVPEREACAAPTVAVDDIVMEELAEGGPVIGFFEGCVYEEATIALQSGDLFIAYTDGLTEAFNEEGLEYSVERLCELLTANAHLSPQLLGEAILKSVGEWRASAPRHDDLTLLIMKMK
jgi:phosphoserine phosphatase RsbU/P